MDKAELCGSLLTWVGRGAGWGQVCAHCPQLGVHWASEANGWTLARASAPVT